MPYYLSKVYEYGKCALISLGGLLGAGSIIYGISLGSSPAGILFIIGGSIWVLQSGMMVLDNRKLLRDIKREIDNLEMGIDQFNAENQRLKVNIEGLDSLKAQYIDEIEKLHKNLKAMEGQMQELQRLKTDYEKQAKALSEGNQRLERSNKDLELNLNNLTALKQNIQKENQELQHLLQEGENQVKKLENIKAAYEAENSELQVITEQQGQDLQTLRTQVRKLGELYENSRKLMLNMAQASSVFDGFADSLNQGLVHIDRTEEGLSETLSGLNRFLTRLTDTSFQMIDTDGDQQISKSEFESLAKRVNVSNNSGNGNS